MNGVAALEQRAPLPSGLSSTGSLASQAEARTLETTPGRDAPTLSKTPPFSKPSKRFRRSTSAVLRRDLGVAIQQLSVASKPSTTEKCWLDGPLPP
ncbi:hypothetical protein RB195_024861 [Necator americanus]|uniref:Uncharacterized protein n=1 Tax=Necator americanus TaxID=51031 RepID=A0ABR1EPY0_NECAM